MPAQTYKRRAGLKGTPRQGIPQPGEGGYGYPRGPYGATGFRGSTAAAAKTHTQGPGGRKDPQYRGRPTLTNPEVWARDTGPTAGENGPWEVPKPQPSPGRRGPLRPGTEHPSSTFHRADGTPRQPFARSLRTARAEHRMTPHIGANAPGAENVRNTKAQNYKARPELWREYRAAPNPGKTGAHLDGPSQYHPDQRVGGRPDGKPIPGMASNPGMTAPTVHVQSRFVSHEGAQEGYAMNRAEFFTKGGTPAPYPPGYEGVRHLRGGRLTGNRYFGAIDDQQKIGLPSDSYGIARKRGPRHRPTKFQVPAPWTANYYDQPGDEGTQSPDMIHKSRTKGRGAHTTTVRRGTRVRRGR